ncbi:hypothetical protein [Hymenobacter terricola]|uniref:hypothetical protein n=1 Tax=Hymenobacter terricola TaxID=2819236 RepID=UPI001B30D19B|nr:hypothetical protein [Hymenobacter terricola]
MSTPTLSFDNSASGDASLFVATGSANGWCAFVAATDGSSSTTPLSFAQVNATAGFVVFAPLAPTVPPATFVANVRAYAKASGPAQYLQLGLMWLADPNVVPGYGTPTFWLNGTGPNSFGILKPFNYSVGNNFMTLFVSNSVTVLADTVLNRYAFAVPEYLPSPAATLRCNPYGAQASVLQYFYVPMTGQGAAHLLFGVGFDAAQLPAFDVGLKYYYPNPETGQPVTLDSPLFESAMANYLVLTDVSFAPFALLNGAQTYVAFTGQTLLPQSSGTQPTVLPTALLTDYGYPVALLPVADFVTDAAGQRFPGPQASRVVLNDQNTDNPNDTWVLQPSGYYTLGVPATYAPTVDALGQLRLLCGLAGTEAISFTPQLATNTGDLLWFKPGAAAYAAGFVPGSPTLPNSAGTLLGGPYVTAWANVVPGSNTNSPVVYYAQPDGAALYAPGQDISAQYSSFLGYYTPSSGVLSAGPAGLAFPLVPYGGTPVGSQLAVLQQYEQQVLSPSRKATIAQALAPQSAAAVAQRQARRAQLQAAGATGTAADTVIHSTSPQGLYIEVDPTTGVWDKLQLASNLVNELVDGKLTAVAYSLEFDTLSAGLQSAFQTNQLFLVISSNVKLTETTYVLGDFTTSSFNEMSIEGWPFTFNIPSQNPNGMFKNILLFKFRSDLALTDLVRQPSQWATPALFNYTDAGGSLGSLPTWLDNYLQSSVTRAQTDPDYLAFATAVADPNWQGILGLNVDISPLDFPEGLQGLLAGIDLARFSAHHFGIDVNFVQAGAMPGTLQMQQNSAMFGLIDYEDQVFESLGYSVARYQQEAPINTAVDYNFRVLSLKVLFANSKITNYSSYLALTVNRVFGERVQTANRQNLLLFAGSYEDHDGTPVYAFNSLPAAAGGSSYVLQVQSPVLGAVEVVKATFNTLVSQTKDDQLISSVFSLWGYLDFNALTGFDLLSYGTPNTGLSFANLNVNLSFPLATPAAVTYAFDISQVSFDPSQSNVRPGSLVNHFPLQLTGITSGDKANSPAAQGYLSVNLPSLAQKQGVSGPWYGLQFNLNMGTLGALAGSLGFNSVFLMAWNVGGTGATAGLKLPGVNPQAPFFSLQGVLRLNIGSVLLTVADDKVSYLMKINDIALKFLVLSFPPNGSVNFFLFGNPNATATPQSLGWYTAYTQTTKAPKALPPAPPRLELPVSDAAPD